MALQCRELGQMCPPTTSILARRRITQYISVFFALAVLLCFNMYLEQNDQQLLKNASLASAVAVSGPVGSAGARKIQFDSPIRFVLFIGVEGTGHHFWQGLLGASPVYQRLVDTGLHPTLSTQLLHLLYQNRDQRWNGLWSGTAKWKRNDPNSNSTRIQEDIAQLLRQMSTKARSPAGNASLTNDGTPILFPVNLLPIKGSGMISYPNFISPSRALQYPNLDVWHEACDAARVSCEHVYIYRDPYAVVKSTTINRKFNRNAMEAIHLYTTELHIIHSQLLAEPRRLASCWNYDDHNSWGDDVRPLIGMAEDPFVALVDRVHKPKAPLDQTQRNEIVPLEYLPYMRSMEKVHNAVASACRRILTTTEQK